MDRRDFLKYSASAVATVLLSREAAADELFTENKDKMKIVVLTGSPPTQRQHKLSGRPVHRRGAGEGT